MFGLIPENHLEIHRHCNSAFCQSSLKNSRIKQCKLVKKTYNILHISTPRTEHNLPRRHMYSEEKYLLLPPTCHFLIMLLNACDHWEPAKSHLEGTFHLEGIYRSPETPGSSALFKLAIAVHGRCGSQLPEEVQDL